MAGSLLNGGSGVIEIVEEAIELLVDLDVDVDLDDDRLGFDRVHDFVLGGRAGTAE
jgi:hypothetical protein